MFAGGKGGGYSWFIYTPHLSRLLAGPTNWLLSKMILLNGFEACKEPVTCLRSTSCKDLTDETRRKWKYNVKSSSTRN